MSQDTALIENHIGHDFSAELPWLVFKLHELTYTLNSRIVITILEVPPTVTPVASAPEVFRGVLNFRGDVLPLLDLRKFYGIASIQDERDVFAARVGEIKTAHINWVNNLQKSIEENTDFAGKLDPTQCALGMWIENIKKSPSTSVVLSHMKSITPPHEKLHIGGRDLLAKVKRMNAEQRREAARGPEMEALKSLRTEIISKLDRLSEDYVNGFHEMIVVVSDESTSLGLIVDEVVAVDKLNILSAEEKFPSFQATKYFSGIAESSKIKGEILLINEDIILDSAMKLQDF